MKKVVEFLQENPVQYLATVGRDGKAKCRPFMFSAEVGGKLWFCKIRKFRFLFLLQSMNG